MTATPSKPAAPASAPAGEKLNVKDLAILQGVEGVEYKKIVQQLSFTSDKDYKTLAAELAPHPVASRINESHQPGNREFLGGVQLTERRGSEITSTLASSTFAGLSDSDIKPR